MAAEIRLPLLQSYLLPPAVPSSADTRTFLETSLLTLEGRIWHCVGALPNGSVEPLQLILTMELTAFGGNTL